MDPHPSLHSPLLLQSFLIDHLYLVLRFLSRDDSVHGCHLKYQILVIFTSESLSMFTVNHDSAAQYADIWPKKPSEMK